MAGRFKVEWVDRNREPQNPANPRFPNGIDLDCSDGASQTCTADLPYPAKRCGTYIADCMICGARVAATTAGRRDDPKSIKIACKLTARA